jgi:hypothetical protein
VKRVEVLPAACLAALALGAALPSAAQAGPRLAVLQPSDPTGSPGAPETVAAAVAEAVQRRGWSVVAGAEVESLLRDYGWRALDTLPSGALPELLERLDASAVLMTRVATWLPGESPIVALSGRALLADGREAWSGVEALTANDTEGVLGLRRIQEIEALAREAALRLLADFPGTGEIASAKPPARRRRAIGLAEPATYRAAELFGPEPLRVCLLPLTRPRREAPEAPRLVADLLARRLAADGGFKIVEPADLRVALVDQRIPTLRRLDNQRLLALGRSLGATVFLRGSIWKWRDGLPFGVNGGTEVELDLELVDVEAGRILWTSHLARRGEDYQRLFLRGAMGCAVGLADQMIAEMLESARETSPAGPRTLTFPKAAVHDRVAGRP